MLTGSQVLTALSQLRGHTPSTLEHWQSKAERGQRSSDPVGTFTLSCLFAQKAHVRGQRGGTPGRNPGPQRCWVTWAKVKLSFVEVRDERRSVLTSVSLGWKTERCSR